MEAESNFESSQAPQIQSLDPSEPPVETQDVQMQEPEQQDQAVHDQVRHKTTEDSAEARNDSKEAETEGDGEGGDEDGYDGEGQDGDEADGDDGEDGEGIGEIEDESGNQSDPASSEGGSDSRKRSSAKGRPRGRPPGTSKVHRGAGRGPLTLNRRGRGRPRKEGAAGRILHEGKIIEPTAKPEGEEAGQGTEGGEDSEPVSLGGAITVGGRQYHLVGDELGLDSDEDGDKKIDAKGRLQGDREWKPHVFTSPVRPDPECLYVLSIDAARAAGYRDSLYFFRKNPLLIKLSLMQGEKETLIDSGRLSGSLRGRNVTMVAARNVFKMHGARMVKNGRSITDDYYEEKARAEGKREGEKVGPIEQDDPASARRELDRQRDRARKAREVYSHQSTDHNGETVLTQFCDAGEAPFVRAEGWLIKRQQLARSDIDEKNWKLEMAKSVRGINRDFSEARRTRKEKWKWDWEGGESLEEDAEKDKKNQDIIGKLTGSASLGQGNASSSAGSSSRRFYLPGSSTFATQSDRRSSTPTTSKRPQEEVQDREIKKVKTEEAPLGVYDPYTGQVHYPRSLQSERARFEKVSARAQIDSADGSSTSSSSNAPILGGVRVGRGAWGVASFTHYLSGSTPALPAGSRGGDTISKGGQPWTESEEAEELPRGSVAPVAAEGTPQPEAHNPAHLASSAPQNRMGPNRKLGKAGQGLVGRAALWTAH